MHVRGQWLHWLHSHKYNPFIYHCLLSLSLRRLLIQTASIWINQALFSFIFWILVSCLFIITLNAYPLHEFQKYQTYFFSWTVTESKSYARCNVNKLWLSDYVILCIDILCIWLRRRNFYRGHTRFNENKIEMHVFSIEQIWFLFSISIQFIRNAFFSTI